MIPHSLIKLVLSSLDAHPVIAHVGAHLGEEAPFYKRLKPKHIYWFEANPNLISELKKKAHPGEETVVWAAVSSGQKTHELLSISNQSGASSILNFKEVLEVYPQISVETTVLIPSITLDSFFSQTQAKPTYLVVDAQGAELLILKGSKEVLRSVRLLEIEVNQKELYEGAPMVKDLDNFLLESGLRRVFTRWSIRKGWGDAIYVGNLSSLTQLFLHLAQLLIATKDLVYLVMSKLRYEFMTQQRNVTQP